MNITLRSLFVALALVTSVSAETLEDAAARIEQRLEDVFLDTNGVMRCSTGASDVTIWESKGPYENVGIVQGFLLQALCAKYAVTHDERDLRKARRRFLLDGRMTPPFVEVGTRESDVPESDVPLRDAAVLSSFWEDAAGHEKLGLLTNWRREAETVTLAWPDGRRERRTLAPLETVVLKP